MFFSKRTLSVMICALAVKKGRKRNIIMINIFGVDIFYLFHNRKF